MCLNASVTREMAAALAAGSSHPVVAGVLGIGAAALSGGVVAMAWNVHVHEIRLAAQLARRQLIVTDAAGPAAGSGTSAGPAPAAEAAGAGPGAPVVIEGPDTVVAGDQARYRVRPCGSRSVEGWAAGGGAVSQSPDPAHPDELLLTADEPGSLTVTVRVRDGMTQLRGIKPVTAVPDVTPAGPAFPLRLFLNGWGLVAVAILIIGFGGALDALGTLAPADFIALVTPLTALLAVLAVARGPGDGGGHPASGKARRPGP